MFDNWQKTQWQSALDTAFLICLMVMAVIIRQPIFHVGLWRDEASLVSIAQGGSWFDVLQKLAGGEMNPPLFYFTMHSWISMVGLDEATLKIPAFVFGLALIPATFLLIRQIGSRGEAAAGALVATFAPAAVYFSQEMRTYTLCALLMTLATTAFLQSLARPTRLSIAFFVLAGTASVYSHYIMVLPLSGLFAAFVALTRRKGSKLTAKMGLIAFLCIGLLSMPLLPLLLPQVIIGCPAAGPMPPLQTYGAILSKSLSYLLPARVPPQLTTTVAVLLVALLGWMFLYRSKRYPSLMGSERSACLSPAAACLVLLLAVIPSVFTNGYLTYFAGVERYVFPVEPLGWALLVLAASDLQTLLAGCLKTARFQPFGKYIKQAVTTILLLCLVVSNASFASELGRRSKSGLRRLSMDIHQGLYPHTAFVVAPDYDGTTLLYYMHQNAPEMPASALHGFARWTDIKSFDYESWTALWSYPAVVHLAEYRILKLFNQGFSHVALLVDSNLPEPATTSVKLPINLLRRVLRADCELQRVVIYRGTEETYFLYLFAPKRTDKRVSGDVRPGYQLEER